MACAPHVWLVRGRGQASLALMQAAAPLAIHMHLLCDSQMSAAALRRLSSWLKRLNLVIVSNAAVHAAWKAWATCVAGCGF